MNLTDFLTSFFGFYGNSFGHGHIGFPVLVEIEVMEEACTEMITFSFWKSPRESSEPFLSSTQAWLQGAGPPIRLQEDTVSFLKLFQTLKSVKQCVCVCV